MRRRTILSVDSELHFTPPPSHQLCETKRCLFHDNLPHKLKSQLVKHVVHVCVNKYHSACPLCVYFQKPAEMEPEKKVVESRYNLRRRKDDGDAKPAEQTEEVEQKPAVATAPITTELEFGGRLGEKLRNGVAVPIPSCCVLDKVREKTMVVVCTMFCQSNCTRVLVCTSLGTFCLANILLLSLRVICQMFSVVRSGMIAKQTGTQTRSVNPLTIYFLRGR